MRVDGNFGSTIGYEPNHQKEWQEQPDYSEPPLKISGDADNYDQQAEENDYFTQAGDLFRLMNDEQRQALFDNTARSLNGVPEFIQQRHVDHAFQADKAYGEGLKAALGL
jgi:catalase